MLMLLLLGLIKLPIAALMLWMPFRNDEAIWATGAAGSSDEDGGSGTLPADRPDLGPRSPLSDRPLPRPQGRTAHRAVPRHRGPHGAPPPPSPRRVRTVSPKVPRVKQPR
jgi:hypothetical protein